MPGIILMPVLTELFDHIKINNPEWVPLMLNHFLPLVQLGLAPVIPMLTSQPVMVGESPC